MATDTPRRTDRRAVVLVTTTLVQVKVLDLDEDDTPADALRSVVDEPSEYRLETVDASMDGTAAWIAGADCTFTEYPGYRWCRLHDSSDGRDSSATRCWRVGELEAAAGLRDSQP